jgi:hypothetical protein
MNTLSLIITGLLTILVVVVFAILLPIAFIFSFRTGMAYRERLAGQIDKLRLGKMLGALGIDIDAYISKERAVDIREQMTRCQACENTDTCDERLEQEDITADSIDFCNNEKTLQEMTKSLK